MSRPRVNWKNHNDRQWLAQFGKVKLDIKHYPSDGEPSYGWGFSPSPSGRRAEGWSETLEEAQEAALSALLVETLRALRPLMAMYVRLSDGGAA